MFHFQDNMKPLTLIISITMCQRSVIIVLRLPLCRKNSVTYSLDTDYYFDINVLLVDAADVICRHLICSAFEQNQAELNTVILIWGVFGLLLNKQGFSFLLISFYFVFILKTCCMYSWKDITSNSIFEITKRLNSVFHILFFFVFCVKCANFSLQLKLVFFFF